MIPTAIHLPLAANFGDLFQAAVFILVMVMWAVGQLMNAKPTAKPPARPRPAGPPRQAAPPGQPGAPQGGGPPTLEETLRREVEEFLRRSQGREKQQPATPQRQPPRRPGDAERRPEPPRRETRSVKPVAARREEPPRRLTDAPNQQTTAQSPEPARGALSVASVSQHVAAHLAPGTQAIAAHAQHLGADVAQADERMEEHLREKFKHQLGSLQQSATQQQAAKRSVIAQEVFAMLTRPGGAKQIILGSEILRRPEDRWARPRPRDT